MDVSKTFFQYSISNKNKSFYYVYIIYLRNISFMTNLVSNLLVDYNFKWKSYYFFSW